MRMMLGLFQTADGGAHWPTLITFAGWLVAGVLMFSSFAISRNDRLKNGPWVFDAKQEAAFEAALSEETKGKIAVEYTKADEKRAYDFAMKLADLLETAGYDVGEYVPAFIQASGPPITGVQIRVKKDMPSDVVGAGIQRAFKTAGIEAAGFVRRDNNYEDDRAVILIGLKP
jgi:hypothetical protein